MRPPPSVSTLSYRSGRLRRELRTRNYAGSRRRSAGIAVRDRAALSLALLAVTLGLMAGKMNVWSMAETESVFRETSFVKRVHLSASYEA